MLTYNISSGCVIVIAECSGLENTGISNSHDYLYIEDVYVKSSIGIEYATFMSTGSK